MMKRKISGIFFTVFFLLGWGGVILKTNCANDMLKLVHPRMVPFVIVSACLALLISLCLIVRRKQHTHAHLSLFKIIMLVIPLVIGLFSRPLSLVADNNVQVTNKGKESAADDWVSEGARKARQSATVNIDSEFFYSIITDIYDNPEIYLGKPVELSGMIFKRKGTKDPRDCAIIRMMMVCCAADMQGVGLICRYDRANELKAKSWYTVSGKIDYLQQGNDKIPYIIVSDVKQCEKPKDDYVYPM
jgi:putative membrane protein